MPFTMEVIRPEDFLRLKADGYLDLAESRRLVSRIGTIMVQNGVDHAILDLRQVGAELTVTDLYELVTTLADAGFRPSHHLAILHRPGPGEMAHFFALCARNRGWQVHAFATFEEAFEWLNRTETTEGAQPAAE